MPTARPGAFAFVLHSHIPYVLSHGRWPHGSDWLLEVTAEAYIPLLNALFRLVDEGYSPKITIGLTPILVEQLADEFFKHEFAAYARLRAKSAQENKREFSRLKDEPMARLAEFWHAYYSGIYSSFKGRYKRSIVKAFAELQEAGHIEIMTGSATHGYSPLLSQDVSIQAQVKQGVATYRRHFKRLPTGYWLPECAYRPAYKWSPPVQPRVGNVEPYDRKGVEEFLQENGLKYFIVESHLLHGGETRGVYIDRFGALQDLWKRYSEEDAYPDPVKTPYAPYLLESTQESGEPVYAFVRDHVTGRQVWSRQEGYPGDQSYLEFHKKHHNGGLRYWKVTGPELDLGDKLIYDPVTAEQRVAEHSKHFAETAASTLRAHAEQTGKPGIICAPYDTELYGHWWFEGVDWLYSALKAMHDNPDVEVMTCSEILESYPPAASISLPEGSWGEGGFHYMWLNEATEWTWTYVYAAELEMKELAGKYSDDPQIKPILKQAARELLLLEASDWQFSISTKTSRDYGEARLTEHYKNFRRLLDIIKALAAGQQVEDSEMAFFKVCEERNAVFKDIDPKWFAELERPAMQPAD